MSMGKALLLTPGFRFHPTDVELILFHLKRKVLGKKFSFEAIAELDIYKHAPWDLPGMQEYLYLLFSTMKCMNFEFDLNHDGVFNNLVGLFSLFR